MSEKDDIKDEMKRLKEEMKQLKQQLHDMTDEREHKRRGIYIDVNDRLAGIGDYVTEVMQGVTEGIEGEIEKSIFIHPHRGHVRIMHRDRDRHETPEHMEKPDLSKAASIMSALGQEHRLKILDELMTGGKYISDFQNAMPEITASTLSSHLDVLQEAGLVVQERVRGRYLVTIPGRIAYKMTMMMTRQRDKGSAHDEEEPRGYDYAHKTDDEPRGEEER